MVANRLPDRLFHFTCVDGLAEIGRADWTLRPNRHPVLGMAVVWLTDMEVPDRASLGLIPSRVVPCDRTEFRLEVEPAAMGLCVWWPYFARTLDRRVRFQFEYGAGMDPSDNPGRPVHWWVAWHPVQVRPYATRHDGATVATLPPLRRRPQTHLRVKRVPGRSETTRQTTGRGRSAP